MSVINGATNSVTANVAVGTDPIGVAVDEADEAVYVTNYGSGTVSVINQPMRPSRGLRQG